jgi:tRNA A37 methylthiotransferase MiaB
MYHKCTVLPKLVTVQTDYPDCCPYIVQYIAINSTPQHSRLTFSFTHRAVSEVDPELRIRFTSPHPKDFPDDVLEIVRGKNNVGKMLHMPAQSGSSSVLDRMKRGYTREAYLSLVDSVRAKIPDVAISRYVPRAFPKSGGTAFAL